MFKFVEFFILGLIILILSDLWYLEKVGLVGG